MYSVLKSYGLNGLNGFAVAVEADVSGGLPAFSLVGLPDSAVRESGDRVRSAVKNLGYKWPDRHITVNLAPADIRKSGPVYDLPLLLAVLASSGQMEEPPADAAFLGELALDGSLRPVSGVLPMALAAAADGIRSLYVPAENAAEAAEAGGDAMQVYPARTAREVVDDGMIHAAECGCLTIEKLEAMTAGCSVGIDMVIIPGDTTPAVISALIADEAAIGMVNSKTTAVRVIPAIGRKAGEVLDFGGLLGYGPIMPVNQRDPSVFINRGGRLPAPMQSLKN